MVDFDDLKGKAESLLGEHGDQVEEGIDKLADLAGKQFGHTGQIDQAADKLKDVVDEQQHQRTPEQRGPGGRPQGKQGGGRPQGKQGGGRRAEGKGPGERPGPKPGPRPQSG
jgi:hypothetical protein